MAGAGCNQWPGSTYETLFGPDDLPVLKDITDSKRRSVGVRVIPMVDGAITAVRYYRAASEAPGGHVGKVYESGALLAESAVEGEEEEACGGWVSLPLSEPLAVTVGATYTVVLDSLLYYAATDFYYASGVSRGGLAVPPGGGRKGAPGSQPSSNQNNRCFWVDGE